MINTDPAKNSLENERLINFLDSERAGENTLDYAGTHGFLTALAICPVEIPEAEWLPIIFEGEPDFKNNKEQTEIFELLEKFKQVIEQTLACGDRLSIPLEAEQFEASLNNWCSGFMEALFLREKEWFHEQEEVIAELTLPIMTLSGLFEEELGVLTDDDKQLSSLLQELPETLIDLYLFFRATPDQK